MTCCANSGRRSPTNSSCRSGPNPPSRLPARLRARRNKGPRFETRRQRISLLRRVDGDAAVLFGKAKHYVAHVRGRPLIRYRDRDENVIVSAVGGYRVSGGSGGQVRDDFARRGVNHAQRWSGAKAERGIEVIVARVVPDLIGALRPIHGGNWFPRQRVQDQKRRTAPATYEQVLGWTESQARAAVGSRIGRLDHGVFGVFQI